MSGAAFEHVRAVVVDWAGTVIDHGSLAPVVVFQEVFRRRGVEITLPEARGPMGTAKRDHIAALCAEPRIADAWAERYGEPPGEEAIDAMYEEFLPLQKATLAKYSRAIDGAADVLQRAQSRGAGIGSTTGYTRELMEAVLPLAAEQQLQPTAVVCSDEVSCGRPAPWQLIEAAKRLNVYPLWRVVKVDDTAPGIEAARAAGAWAVGVSRTGNGVGLSVDAYEALSDDEQMERLSASAAKLESAGAHFVIESIADLEPLLEDVEDRLRRGERPEAIDPRAERRR